MKQLLKKSSLTLAISTIVCTATLTTLLAPSATACSRVLFNKTTPAVMVGRNMDWSTDLAALMQTNLIVYPRGIDHDGFVAENPIHWQSKYGSIIATAYHDKVATDGFNERGLAAHMLWYQPADYGTRDVSRPGLSLLLTIQFFLDNFATVNEATDYIKSTNMQIVPLDLPSVGKTPQHFILEDATGDSAIIEYDNGQPVIYHDHNYQAATNEPSYRLQLQNAAEYAGLGGDKPLPGTLSPDDRFVRALYYIKHMPKPKNVNTEVAEMFSVLNSMMEPYEIHSQVVPHPIPTIWQTVSDLTHKIYYFHDVSNLNTFSVDLSKFDLNATAAPMKLDLQNGDALFGDVTNRFKKLS